MERNCLEGLSPLAELSLNTPTTEGTSRKVERSLTWSSDNFTPRRKGPVSSSSSRFRLKFPSDRASLMRRLNSAPSPSAADAFMKFEPASTSQSFFSNNQDMQYPTRSPSPRIGKENSFTVQSSISLCHLTEIESDTQCSQDSGCVVDEGFRFPSSPRLPIKNLSNNESPIRRAIFKSPVSDGYSSLQSPVSSQAARSCSFESLDDFSDIDKLPDTNTESNSMVLGNLLTGPLLGGAKKVASGDSFVRPPLRRTVSLVEPSRSSHRDPDDDGCNILSSKRPCEFITNAGFNSAKRRKSSLQSLENIMIEGEKEEKEKSEFNRGFKLQRSATESCASDRFHYSRVNESELIGDYSVPYALPVIRGRHDDLKSIASDTLASLLNGDYDSTISSFKIIDCRYPYEYEAGHIRGSLNLYTFEQIEELVVITKNKNRTRNGRHILIFHCEFSIERGPTLYRHLRRCDRRECHYPSLFYPELYLLHGGYQSFHASHKVLCEPSGYMPMTDPKHEKDLRKFRSKSNTLGGFRSSYKRLNMQ